MAAVDPLQRPERRVRVAPVDPTKPIGVHQPKKQGDVGWDLEVMEDTMIHPGEAIDVPVNARLELPPDVWVEIRARSSISRMGLQVDAGTIDNGYRGKLYVLVRNMKPSLGLDESGDVYHLENYVMLRAGERIGQLVFYRMCHVWAEHVEEIDTASDRGEAGFGSTGR